MRHRKEFWLTLMALCVLFYGRALWHVIEGETGALSVIIAAIIIGLHILEVPMALRLLRNRNPNPIKVSALTAFIVLTLPEVEMDKFNPFLPAGVFGGFGTGVGAVGAAAVHAQRHRE